MTDLPSPRLLRWETDTRYYLAWVHQDLFATWMLSMYWGGRGARRGGERHRPLASATDAEAHLARIAKTRERHGYRPVAWRPPAFEARLAPTAA